VFSHLNVVVHRPRRVARLLARRLLVMIAVLVIVGQRAARGRCFVGEVFV
jgi:hypothetical protein